MVLNITELKIFGTHMKLYLGIYFYLFLFFLPHNEKRFAKAGKGNRNGN